MAGANRQAPLGWRSLTPDGAWVIRQETPGIVDGPCGLPKSRAIQTFNTADRIPCSQSGCDSVVDLVCPNPRDSDSWPALSPERIVKTPFRPRSRLLQLLAEELIDSPRLAIFEFVKNAYDADATEVAVRIDLNSDADPTNIVTRIVRGGSILRIQMAGLRSLSRKRSRTRLVPDD